MIEIAAYQYSPGKWAALLLWLEQAWRRGDETELITGECLFVEKVERNCITFAPVMI